MFLFERAFGIGVYMLLLVFVCAILTFTNASCKGTLKFYLLCLCVMAFFYKPYITADLYRIHDTLDLFGGMSFSYFFENHCITSATPAAALLYWCIGKTGSHNLISVFSAFVCYSCVFYIISKTQEVFKVSKKTVPYVLFFLMSTSMYISVIGGIRMMLALSIASFCFFKETVLKKVSIFDIVLYALAVFLHAMALVLVPVCFAVMLFDDRKSYRKRIATVFFVGMAAVVFIVNFKSVIIDMLEKANDYVTGDRYSDTWEYIMGTFILALLVFTICEYWHIRKENGLGRLKLINAVGIICAAISILFCFEFSIFIRFGGQLAVILLIPMMMVTFDRAYGRSSRVIKKIDYKSIFLILSCLAALVSCSRGSLSSLKFFEL